VFDVLSPSNTAPERSIAPPRWLIARSGLAIAGIALFIAAPAAATTTDSGASVERALKDPTIVESSGLARSRYSDTRLWTHNDSGGGTTIFAIAASGRTKARFELTGASHSDWEGMASAKRSGVSYLFVGDIGDNGSKRSTIYVHRVREPRPGVSGRSLKPVTYAFKYPDGPHNAETLMVKPGSLRIYVVTKGKQQPGAIYAAKRSLSTKRVNVLRKVGPAPAGMADGVFLDRSRFVLRGYESGWLYRNVDSTPKRFPLPIKGESITTAWRKKIVLIGSEGRYSEVWRVPLP
jgi:hypothetical protein